MNAIQKHTPQTVHFHGCIRPDDFTFGHIPHLYSTCFVGRLHKSSFLFYTQHSREIPFNELWDRMLRIRKNNYIHLPLSLKVKYALYGIRLILRAWLKLKRPIYCLLNTHPFYLSMHPQQGLGRFMPL